MDNGQKEIGMSVEESIPEDIAVQTFLSRVAEQFEDDVQSLEEGEGIGYALDIERTEDGFYAHIE